MQQFRGNGQQFGEAIIGWKKKKARGKYNEGWTKEEQSKDGETRLMSRIPIMNSARSG